MSTRKEQSLVDETLHKDTDASDNPKYSSDSDEGIPTIQDRSVTNRFKTPTTILVKNIARVDKLIICDPSCLNTLPENCIRECQRCTDYSSSTNRNVKDESGTFLNRTIWKIISLVAVILSVLSFLFYNSFLDNGLCDMSIAENRDFNKYFGLSHSHNPFTTTSADQCDSSIIFRPVLPQTILRSDNTASSFAVSAKYGTGKTVLRCQYYNSLDPKKYFKVLLLNKHITPYLERFVSSSLAVSSKGNECSEKTCLTGWSEYELGQLLLSVLVTELVNTFEDRTFDLSNMSLDEKIEVIIIVCYYYYGDGVIKLEQFVNFLLGKNDASKYITDQASTQFLERNIYYDKPLLSQFKRTLAGDKTLQKNEQRLELLLHVVEGENYENAARAKTIHDTVVQDLIVMVRFIKTRTKRSVVFIIDGIDENRFFYQNNIINEHSVNIFYQSIAAQQIQSALMAHDFYLALFYPDINGSNIDKYVSRKDKFPIFKIEWNTASLLSYSDYLLQELNKKASTARCKSVTDFKSMVNYSDERIAEIIDEIRTPRELNYFMTELIREMNADAGTAKEPFKATYENVQHAAKESKELTIVVL